MKLNGVDPVQQILPELPLGYPLVQIRVSRTNEPDINCAGFARGGLPDHINATENREPDTTARCPPPLGRPLPAALHAAT